jgi:hypothetical protein
LHARLPLVSSKLSPRQAGSEEALPPLPLLLPLPQPRLQVASCTGTSRSSSCSVCIATCMSASPLLAPLL